MKRTLFTVIAFILLFSTQAMAASKKAHAKLDVMPLYCESPCEVTLSAKRSTASSSAKIEKYIFDLGNGEIVESRDPVIKYTYKVVESDLDTPSLKKGFKNFFKWLINVIRNKHSIKVFDTSVSVVDSKNKKSTSPNKHVRIKAQEGSANKEPIAEFSISINDNIAPSSVVFDGTTSSDEDGEVISYFFDFGDGTSSEESSSTHIYQSAGTYSVTLTVTDDQGAKSYATRSVTIIENSLPIASFTSSIDSGKAPLKVTFDASNSSDSDGNIVSFHWVIGNAELSGKNISHSFDTDGIFTVVLTVTDNKGGKNTSQSTITVLPINKTPNASFTLTEGTYIAPQKIAFSAEKSTDLDGTIESYFFDFGDNSTSDQMNVKHTYSDPGTYLVKLTVTDNDGATGVYELPIEVKENVPPVAVIEFSEDQLKAPAEIMLSGEKSSDSDGSISSWEWTFEDGTVLYGAVVPYIFTVEGNYQVKLKVIDNKGGTSEVSKSITIGAPNIPPVAKLIADKISGEYPFPVFFDASGSVDDDGGIVSYEWNFGDGEVEFSTVPVISHEYNAKGTFSASVTVVDNDGATSSSSLIIQVEEGVILPPDPKDVAPELSVTEITDIADATSFLYKSENPIQKGVSPDAIQSDLVSVLRGQVLDTNSNPLPGVKVYFKNNPELGYTFSRKDGFYDMAINGGMNSIISYEKKGFLSVQRVFNSNWKDYNYLDDIIMTELDSVVSEIDLNSIESIVAISGSQVSDERGSRTSTLAISPGTTAQMVLADGSKRSIEKLSIRMTEYTVGENGSKAMPGVLPESSAYTYAVEFSVDEAIELGAKTVEFNKPIYNYVDNFVGAPVGVAVPSGYYDRESGKWIASEDGLVAKVISITDGVANVDVFGTGVAATEDEMTRVGLTVDERKVIAKRFSEGESFWRTPIRHFTPYDLNFMVWVEDIISSIVTSKDKVKTNFTKPNCGTGSIIDYDNRCLGEHIKIPGSSFELSYNTRTQFSYEGNRRFTFPVTGYSFDERFRGLIVEVKVAGRKFEYKYGLIPNQKFTFTWDGYDAYGRKRVGAQNVEVVLKELQPVNYCPNPASLSYNSSSSSSSSSDTVITKTFGRWVSAKSLAKPYFVDRCFEPIQNVAITKKTLNFVIGGVDAKAQKLGGWGVSLHHFYDSLAKKIFKGSGEIIKLKDRAGTVLRKIFGNTNQGYDVQYELPIAGVKKIKFAANGDLYLLESHGISKISSDKSYTRIMQATNSNSEDWTSSVIVKEKYPVNDFDVDPDGNIYFISSDYGRVYKIDGEYNVNLLGGTASSPRNDFTYEGMISDAQFYRLKSIVVDKDGSYYLADYNSIMHVLPSGETSIILGGGYQHPSKENSIFADEAYSSYIEGIAISEDGELYYTADETYVAKITKERKVELVAGSPGYSAPEYVEGTVGARDVRLSYVRRIALDKTGVYIIDERLKRILYCDFMTDSLSEFVGNGKDYTGQIIDYTPSKEIGGDMGIALTIGPDRKLYFVPNLHYIYRVELSERVNDEGHFLIPDGNSLYEFTKTGIHLKTTNAVLGNDEYVYKYQNGLLSSIVDKYGRTFEVVRDSNGIARELLSENGLKTTLDYNEKGDLKTVSYPNGAKYNFTYKDGAELLESFTDPMQNSSLMEYSNKGELIKDTDARGGFKEIVPLTEATDDSYKYNVYTAEGRVATYTRRQSYGTTFNMQEYPTGKRIEHSYSSIADNVFESNGMSRSKRYSPGLYQESSRDLTLDRYGLTNLSASMLVTHKTEYVFGEYRKPSTLQSIRKTTQVNGAEYTYLFDKSSLESTTTAPDGVEKRKKLNSLGDIVYSETVGLAPTNYSYYDDGNIKSITIGDRITQFKYNELGYLAEVIDPLGRVTSYQRDLLGLPLSVTYPDLSVSNYRYDLNSNLIGITPPKRPEHIFSFNAVNIVDEYNAPTVGDAVTSTSYSYNLDQDLTSKVRDDGKSLFYHYKTLDDGTPTDLLESVSSDDGTIIYEYDSNERLTSIKGPESIVVDTQYLGLLPQIVETTGDVSGSVEFTYNNFLVPNVINVNGITTVYGFTDEGKISSAGNLAIEYDASKGGVISETNFYNVSDKYTFSEYGELASYSVNFSSNPLISIDYSRDKLGRITKIVESSSGNSITTDYGYDLSGRVESVTVNDVLVESYQYDENGNRAGGVYDDQDRLLEDDSFKYTYTAAGELLTKARKSDLKVETYRYDVFGNLREVKLLDDRNILYIVDGLGRRIGKRINGELKQGLLYKDQLNPVAELSPNGELKSIFVYATKSHVPDYFIQGADSYRIISDHLGSVRYVVKVDDGTIMQEMTYDTFGKVLKDTNPGFQPFGFAGGLYDSDTGLIRFGARDYNPSTGRWTAKDPIKFDGGINLYQYSKGDPVNYLDINGKNPLSIIFGVVGGFFGGVVGGETSAILYDDLEGWDYAAEVGKGIVSGAVQGAIIGIVAGFNPAYGVALGAILTPYNAAVLSESLKDRNKRDRLRQSCNN